MKMLLFSIIAVFLPDLYADLYATTPKINSIQLISIEINGENYNSILEKLPTLVRGDTIKLKSIEIGKLKSDRLDIVGFETPVIEGQLPHDENIEIETKNQIALKSIQAGFITVVAYRNDRELLKFNLPIKSPEWTYSELHVNQKSLIARPGDKLKMDASDQVQLVRIETNLEQNDLINVKFENKSKQKSILTSRLVFYYRDYAFGSVPIQLTKND